MGGTVLSLLKEVVQIKEKMKQPFPFQRGGQVYHGRPEIYGWLSSFLKYFFYEYFGVFYIQAVGMGDVLVEIMDIHVHLAGVLVIFHGFVFLAYLLGHLALANEGAQVIVVRLDPGADASSVIAL